MKLIVEMEITNKNCINCVLVDLTRSIWIADYNSKESPLLVNTFQVVNNELSKILKKISICEQESESVFLVNPVLKNLGVGNERDTI